MNHQETIRAEAGASDSVNERFANSMAESVRNLLHGICNSVRRLIRNVALVTQVSAVSLGVIGCGTSPATEELDHPAQCVSKNPSPEPDDTPQCDGAMSASPVVKEVAVCFMRWSDSYYLTDEIRAKLNAEFDLATRFFTEATFGRDLYRFDLIDSGTVWAGPSPANMDDDIDFAIQACAPQINDFNKIDTFVVFPSFDDVQATGERKTVSTPDGDREMGVIRLPHYTEISDTLYPGLYDLRHEIGHSDYLWNHAGEYYCFDDMYQQVTFSPNPNCTVGEYGNRFDVMGRGIILYSDSSKIFGHPGGFEKSLSGLVKVANITENSGIYPLAALEVPCSVPQLLRIPYRDFPLCLEYRKPIGFDALFSMDNIVDGADGMVHEDGLPSGGCVFLQICTNVDKSTLLLKQKPFSDFYQNRLVGTCLPREGFYDSNLGIDVRYSQSTTNSNAVMVDVSGVDETRLAKLPNLKMKYMYVENVMKYVYVENVSETGESVGAFNIQISGRRISDGQFEVIETRTIDGLPLFGKVAINFPPDQLKSLKLIYSELRVTADSGNVIEETDEADNEVTYGIAP